MEVLHAGERESSHYVFQSPTALRHGGAADGKRGPCATREGETPPRRWFGQWRHDQIEGMRGSPHGQQISPPQLPGTHTRAASATEFARINPSKEIIGSVRTQQFKQAVGANGRQCLTQDRTLTQPSLHNTPLVSA